MDMEAATAAAYDLLPTEGFEIIGGLDAYLSLPGVADTPAGQTESVLRDMMMTMETTNPNNNNSGPAPSHRPPTNVGANTNHGRQHPPPQPQVRLSRVYGWISLVVAVLAVVTTPSGVEPDRSTHCERKG